MTIDQMMQQGTDHHRFGRFAQAEELYLQVLEQNRSHADALHQLGMLLARTGREESAIQLVRQAIAVQPTDALFYNTLGRMLRARHDLAGAMDNYQKALQLQPDSAQVLNNLGNLLYEQGQYPQAAENLRRAAQLAPDTPEIFTNLANVLMATGDYEAALAAFDRTLELRPNFAGGHWNRALLLLSLGRFEQGWREFEWRLQVPEFGLKRHFPQPQWNGEDLRGKTILLFAEGGFGDTFHFIRYLPMVVRREAKIILECQPEAKPLLERQLTGALTVVGYGQPLLPFDWQIPLPSLPLVFGTTMENIPADVPYLQAPADFTEAWAVRMADDKALRVGLAWAGSGKPDDLRSRSLAIFASLGEIPGVSFYRLQKGREAAEPPPSGIVFKNSQPLGDFCDTAGLMANLDLIISVDTSVVHLAGALGRPVWVLLPTRCDFRWLLNREDSPWYPTMRLFRQTKYGQWSDVVLRMAAELKKLIKS